MTLAFDITVSAAADRAMIAACGERREFVRFYTRDGFVVVRPTKRSNEKRSQTQPACISPLSRSAGRDGGKVAVSEARYVREGDLAETPLRAGVYAAIPDTYHRFVLVPVADAPVEFAQNIVTVKAR